MNEDIDFNAFLKAKLEEDVEVPAVRVPRRSFWSVPRAYLAAASLAAVCLIGVSPLALSREDPAERHVSAAIAFLEELGESATSVSADTFEETLLAWQDAPYAELAE